MRELDGLLEKARQDPDVIAVLLFGSAARGEPYRDIDVALVLRPGSGKHPYDIRIDYMGDAPQVVDVQVFQDLPLQVQMRILREGRVLQCRDEDELYRIACAAVRAWDDFKPFYRAYLEDVAHA